jgi:hypothetical protein
MVEEHSCHQDLIRSRDYDELRTSEVTRRRADSFVLTLPLPWEGYGVRTRWRSLRIPRSRHGRGQGHRRAAAGMAGIASERRREALRGSALSPLVGRDEEIVLLRRWARDKAGDGQVGAGLGRTRPRQVAHHRGIRRAPPRRVASPPALFLFAPPPGQRAVPRRRGTANAKDLHRPLRAGDDLEDAFAWKEERTLSQALTLQYDKVIFILEPSEQAKAAIGKRVTVVDYPDGRLSIRYRGVELAYRTFDKLRQVDQGAIADNKRLGAVLAMIRNQQLRRGSEGRSGPRRHDQRDARLFKVG